MFLAAMRMGYAPVDEFSAEKKPGFSEKAGLLESSCGEFEP